MRPIAKNRVLLGLEVWREDPPLGGPHQLGEGNLFLLLADGHLGVAEVGAVLGRKRLGPQARSWRLRAVGVFVLLSGSVAGVILAVAYNVGPGALVAPVAASYPVVATLGAGATLREKLDWRVLLALVLFGVGLLSTG